jgi:hypothetical protein
VLTGRTYRDPAAADYLFITGTALKNDGSGQDFGVARLIVPIFNSSFQESLTQ